MQTLPANSLCAILAAQKGPCIKVIKLYPENLSIYVVEPSVLDGDVA